MRDNRPAIGLDIDGCLAGFSQKFIQLLNARYGLNAKPENQTTWEFGCFGATPEQESEIWQDIYATRNFWLSLEPLSDTHVLTYAKDKYRIYFITARPPCAGHALEDQTAMWIRRHFFIANPTVIVSSHKGPLAAALNLDYFLDDRPENTLQVRAFSPFTKVFIHSAPYNTEFNQGSIERVGSVNEFFRKVKGDLDEQSRRVFVGQAAARQ